MRSKASWRFAVLAISATLGCATQRPMQLPPEAATIAVPISLDVQRFAKKADAAAFLASNDPTRSKKS